MKKILKKSFRIGRRITALAIFFAMLSGLGASAIYSDAPSEWALDEVNAAKSKGLVIAEADQNYRSNISRRLFCAMVVNMVEKLSGETIEVTISNPFGDTDEAEVVKAYQLGIVKGVSETRFAPEDFITREQIAAMMMRGARKLDELKGARYAYAPDSAAVVFADQGDISPWALEDIQTAYRLGIVRGIGENRIDPNGNTTVEQSILLINRLYDGFTAFTESGGSTGVPANRPPKAISNPVIFFVPEQSPLIITASQIAADPDGDGLEILEVRGSCLIGAAELTPDRKCRYASADIVSNGADSFSLVVSDGRETVEVPVRVNVIASLPANNPPVAISNPVIFSVAEQTPLTIAASQLATDPDGGTLSIVRVNGGTADYRTLSGTVSLTSDGKCTFVSGNITANSTDDFAVTISDGVNETNVNVRINVSAAPDINFNFKPTIASVSINGAAALGESLGAGLIRYSGTAPGTAPEFAYQWMISSSMNGSYIDIPGATGAAYVPTKNDIGKYIKLRLTASGSASGSATSAAKGPVGRFYCGDGSSSNPYQISNAEQFMLLNDMATAEKHFRLASDIVLGENEYVKLPFWGTLDGNGKKITISVRLPDNEEAAGLGLFKNVAVSGTVKNLLLSGKIIAKKANNAGGVSGYNYGSLIKCLSTADIVTGSASGGIAGSNGGTIKQCGVTCRGVGNGEAYLNITGGLVGWNFESGIIENCFSRAITYGGSNVGGLIGLNYGSVKYCYSSGKVNGNSQTGGFIGQNGGGSVSYCYYDMETSGKKDSGWGYVPRTTAQMKLIQNYVGWDFSTIWSISADQYPELRMN